MLRNLVAALFCLGMLPQTVLGAGIQLIEGLPSSYIPGQPVTFDVRLPTISNLGSYNIDLVLEGNVGVAGTDYYFDVGATIPAATNYVFPMSANFFDAVNVDSPTLHRLTLTDFDISGVNVVAGQNERVATVVLQTAPGFSGPLSVFVDAPSLILDTPDVVPTPVPNFDTIQAGIAAAGPGNLLPVPEPTSIAGLIAGLALTIANCRRNRHLAC